MMQELFPSVPTIISPPKEKKPRKPRKPRDPNAPRKISVPQQIIINLVSDMRGCKDAGIWKNEMRVCATLRKKYGDEFLLWVKPLEGYKFGSLVFYLSVLGKNYLSDQLVEFAKYKGVGQQQTKEIPLAPAKIGEDVVTVFTPRTLKEFLNYGKDIAREQAGQQTGEKANDSNGADGSLPQKQ
jgi:hypothetical protein